MRQDSLLLVELLKLLCKLLVLGHVLFALFHADAIMLRNSVQLGQSVPQLLQLVNLLIPQLLRFLVLLLKFSQFFSQVSQPLSRILHLLQDIWLILVYETIKFLLSSELVNLELSFKLFLLFDFLLGGLEITL